MFVYYGIGLMLCPLADVIAFFSNHRRFRADVITLILILRLMPLPCGRWNLKMPSPIYDHYNITGHETNIENFSIVGREDQNLIRAIKEAIYIRVNSPSLNRNIGKYHLPHIWHEVLLNNPELKLK